MELRGSYLEVKIHSPKNPIGEFVARGCRIWLTLLSNYDCIFLPSFLGHWTMWFVLMMSQWLMLFDLIFDTTYIYISLFSHFQAWMSQRWYWILTQGPLRPATPPWWPQKRAYPLPLEQGAQLLNLAPFFAPSLFTFPWHLGPSIW